ncbi:hypothetical protein DNTS_027809 [Danionella cerebrum]|uniref:Ig-like domain-containing protein n=1 Tax=Danionella cerebrum TaxID=2873325 RepID=A0A553RNR5_9TELE|nr:hypothetical protein DNTS_027809 [Danionella translucida]
MTELQSFFCTTWIFCCLMIGKCSDVIVQSFEGDTVTLPCQYDSKYHGKLHICWMRGDIPRTGCGDEIIGSDGDKVVRNKLERYNLLGPIQQGDVSLTIFTVDKKDSGKYGCRIHIPGLFNDEWHYVHLIVDDAPLQTTAEPLVTSISGHLTSDSQTTESSEEASVSVVHHESSIVQSEDGVTVSAIIVPVLLLLMTLVAIAAILMWKQKKKTRVSLDIVQDSDIAVIYSNSDSTVGLYSREMAVENVYQMQTESDYEQWH